MERQVFSGIRRLSTLIWAMIGVIVTAKISPSAWGEVVISRAQQAASHRRRFIRWLPVLAVRPGIGWSWV